MSSGHDEIPDDTPAGEATSGVTPEDAVSSEASIPIGGDEELTGQADLDEQLAKPVFEGTAGIDTAQVWIGAFLILVAALIAYSNSFSIPMQYPDRDAILQNPGAQSIVMSPIGAKASGVALLPMITIAANSWFAPGAMPFFHAFNVALHALNGVLVYLLARRLLKLNQKKDEAQGGFELSEPIAMVGGLLVALHPLATESVNLIIGRASLLCATFSLLSIVLVLRAADKEQGVGVGALIGAVVCFGIAWACDITALFVPALMLMADWIANGNTVIKRLPVHAAFWGIAIALGAWWLTVSHLNTDPYSAINPATIVPPPVKAAAFSRGVKLSVNPTALTIDHDLPPAGGFLDPEEPGSNPVLAATTGIGLGLVALILVAARSPAGLGLAWFLLALLPSAYFIAPHAHFNERGLYFGLCGIGLLLPWLVSKAVSTKSTAIVGGLAVVAVLIAAAGGTYLRNRQWQDETQLWEDAALASPGAPEPFIRLGTIHHDAGQRAVDEYEQLLRSDQKPAAAAQRELAQAELGAAMNYLQQAVAMKPDDARLRATLGNTLAILNKRDDAIATLTEALRLEPSLQDCTVQLASLYAANPADPVNTEGKQKALDYFERAARLGPLKPDAAVNYAALLARGGDAPDAARIIAPYVSGADPKSAPAIVAQQIKPMVDAAVAAERKAQEAEKTAPGAPDTIKLRIHALLANGQNLPAFYQLARYLQLHPDDAEAWLLMGTTRARAGEQEAFTKEYGTPPAIKEGEIPLWTRLVRLCAEQGRWMAARAYLEFAAKQSDAFSKPLLRLGQLAMELKQPTVAATMLDQAAKADATDPEPWLTLCDLALEAKNLPMARRALDEAERRNADPAAVAPRREKAGATPESEKLKPRTVLQ